MSKIEFVEKNGKKVETVVINGKPFWNWGRKEHQEWQKETQTLIEYSNLVYGKLIKLAKMKGWIK